jgi:anti-sigma factor RsiW
MPGDILNACSPVNYQIGCEGATMGKIITLSGGQHLDTQALLPWYVSRRLDASETARVEAHLADCSECRADVASERRLAAEWATMPMETEASWLRLRERLNKDDTERARPTLSSSFATARSALTRGRSWLSGVGWALAAAQAIALAVIVTPVRAPAPAPYHALGAAQGPSAGNVLVIFDPDTNERRFRDALETNHARIVDGPTASGVYVLHVPADERSAMLMRMQARPDVELAQPIDPGASR